MRLYEETITFLQATSTDRLKVKLQHKLTNEIQTAAMSKRIHTEASSPLKLKTSCVCQLNMYIFVFFHRNPQPVSLSSTANRWWKSHVRLEVCTASGTSICQVIGFRACNTNAWARCNWNEEMSTENRMKPHNLSRCDGTGTHRFCVAFVLITLWWFRDFRAPAQSFHLATRSTFIWNEMAWYGFLVSKKVAKWKR